MVQLWNEWKIWLPLGLLVWQAVLSLIDFALCGWDKLAAKRGARRRVQAFWAAGPKP